MEEAKKLHCSVGVIVYNEAANIGNLLTALLHQELKTVVIDEIIVVSSACTDGTDALVELYMKQDERISLICESERRGKSAAINTFLKASHAPLCVIESGDTIPGLQTIEAMVGPFADYSVGMTGGRPTPENDPSTFIGYAVHLLWQLHHRMAMISPKLGEMVAFRRVFEEIPPKSAVDEASIEALIREAHLQLRYIPEAIVYNKGPENTRDFIKQRRRIEAGHLWLKQNQHYTVASQKSGILLQILGQELQENPKQLLRMIGVMALEIYCRFLGQYDFYWKKINPYTWEIAESTKALKHKVVS